MTPELRRAMGEAAVKAARSVDYVGAGTVEFLLDQNGEFYFLEMNTRQQVEHPVTELVTGQDLVAWQLRVAEGQPLPLTQDAIRLSGHAIEVRLYAEDSSHDFMPQTGNVLRWEPVLLDGIRIDHGLLEGRAITPFYDPMLAKIIAYGATRDEARRKLVRAVEDCVLLGVKGNQRFLANLLKHPEFAAGNASTAFIAEHFAADPSLSPQPPGPAELASAAALLYQTSAQSSAHQAGLAGWRNAGNAPWRFLLRHDEQQFAVELTVLESGQQPRLRASVGDQQLHLRLLGADGRWATLELDGVRRRLAYQQSAGTLWLYGDNGNLELTDVTHAPACTAVGTGSGLVKAPMDGAIVELLIEDGNRVSKGQLLLVLEAMKMEHQVKASIDGIIRRVQVSKGDQVRNRQQLLEVHAE
jgi:geranyl-CoA carboxylase alpha subunit